MYTFKHRVCCLIGAVALLSGLVLPGQAQAAGTISLLPEVTYDVTGAFGDRLILIADLDGDGKMDLQVTTPSLMAFLYGKGDGTFPSTSRASTRSIYWAGRAAAADVNGDGRLDVVFPYQNTVCARLNQGLRQFAPMVSYPVGSSPKGVVAADFNGDGRPDIAVANQASNNLGVLLNHGDGTFAPTVFYLGANSPVGLVSADFNGDGKADLAMSNSGSGEVIVYRGDGQGGFSEAGRYATGGAGPTLLVTNDFNGDGKPDLAVANSGGNSIALLFGDGQGGFSQPVVYGGISAPHDMACGDLDGDGAPDLVVTNGGLFAAPRAPTSFFWVLQNAGNGSFLAPVMTIGGLNGTYTVAVGDLNGDGKPDIVIGSYGDNGSSNCLSVLINNSPVSPPENLTLSVASLTQINLTWADRSPNETGFEVQRQLVGGTWAPLATLPPNTTHYANLNLTPYTTYLYRVRALNSQWPSDWSNIAWIETSRPPAAPTGLAVSPISMTQLDLTWHDNSSNEFAFEVWRQQGTGASSQIAILTPNTTHYSDTGLTLNTSYSYRIKVTGAEGVAWSNTATGSTPLPPPPLPPSNLRLTLVSATQINLTWTDRSDNETSFEIQRQVAGGPWAPVGSVPANSTGYPDTSVSPMKTYIYRVRAVNAAGPSPWWSNEAWMDTVMPPAAPTDLQLRTASPDLIVFSWRDNSGDELAFEVWRKSATSDYQQIAQLGPNVTLYTDWDLTPGATYTYRVRAIGAQGASAWTNEVSWSVPPGP